MAPPRIGLVTYGRDPDGWFTLPGQYVDGIRRAGGLPLLLAPGEPHLEDWFGMLDGLILAGGGDLEPARYGGRSHAEIYKLDADRDADELWLARRARDAELPTLGICRGLQVANVAFGGTLIEHLPDEVDGGVAHRSPAKTPTPHPVEIDRGTALARIAGTTTLVGASWHHQAVRAVATGFRVVARAADGVIEAMQLDRHRFFHVVQWHPELTATTDPAQQRLFAALVDAARSGA